MKLRTAIAVILGLSVFASIALCFGLAGVYCSQAFDQNAVPLICADTKLGFPTWAKLGVNLLGCIVLFVVPTLVGYLYTMFGWPRGK